MLKILDIDVLVVYQLIDLINNRLLSYDNIEQLRLHSTLFRLVSDQKGVELD